jgi:protein O-GlcNAc transferase
MAQLTVEQAMQIAFQHHQAGRLAEAENVYRQVLSVAPNHADALHLRGVIALQSGRLDPAVELIRQAIALRPTFADAYANLGKALTQQGKIEEAIEAYRGAIEANPAFALAYCTLGILLRRQGKPAQAVQAYLKSIELSPQVPETHSNLANALGDQKKFHEAIAEYAKAIQLKPNYAEAHSNLGNAFREIGKLQEATAAHARAIQLKPDYGEAHYNIAIVQKDLGKLDEAEASLLRAIQIAPEHPEPHNNLGSVRKDQRRMEEALACYRQAMKLNPGDPLLHSNFLYAMHFHPGYDRTAIYDEHRKWNQLHAVPLEKFIEPHRNVPDPDRRLRIGYVSPDFSSHPVGRFLLPLIANHDRERFEVFCYADVRAPDSHTVRLQSHAGGWRNILGMSHAEVARLVREDGIDILIDLTLHMSNNRLPLFARKPAPVQVTYLAYCSTTGLDTMDYRLTDGFLDPVEWVDGCYSEKSARLPRTYWCYEPHMDCPEAAPLPALSNGAITFGCLNNFCKVSPAALEAWGTLLARVPRSRLLLHAQEGSHRQHALNLLHRHGVEPSRIEFVASRPMAEYFGLYGRIDIALDPFPYAGGTTTCDALWMGVPVITLAGATAVGRSGVSLLSNAGLPDLITQSPQDYVSKATELAGDLPALATMRAGLRERIRRSPLMDAVRFAADVEAAYRRMWRVWIERSRI